MTDEQKTTGNHNHDHEKSINDRLDSLLPAPDESAPETRHHDQVDGPIDEVLPSPGEPDTSADDASTREELEVDTTADDENDFISLEDERVQQRTGDEPTDTMFASDVDTSEDAPPGSMTCLVCGEESADARFCPACGTEQIPASRFVAGLSPLFMWSRTLPIRMTMTIGIFLALFALLADSGTSAIIISSSIAPVVLLIWLTEKIGGQSRNAWIQICMMILIGTAAGLPIAWLSARIVTRSWFEGRVIQFGATNFGGIAVETAGNAPILVWLASGILLPLVMLLAIGAAPAGLRMALTMPLREYTGMVLSASVAAGFMIGSAAVLYWPMYSEIAPIMSTSEWTLTILGVAVVRPLIWVFSGAMLGAVVWRYLRNAELERIALPAGIAITLPLGYSILSLAAAPAGLWVSMIVGIGFAMAAIYFHLRFLKAAEKNDASL